MSECYSRRDFVKGLAAATAGAATVGLAGCADQGTNAADTVADIKWDYETGFVVVGTGTAFLAPFMLDKAGADFIVLEAQPTFGGTMSVSGCGCWVPRNHRMDAEGFVDLSADEIMEYVRECDVFDNVDEALLPDYVKNAPKAWKYFENELQFYSTYAWIADYYVFEKGEFTGRRKLNFCDSDHESNIGVNFFPNIVRPRLEEKGFNVMYNTTATRLLTDDSGAVIGVVADSGGEEINIKIAKGVLLATGGFDWNDDMRREYLRFPIFGTNNVKSNNGSGHRMAQEVGAAFGNMGSVWGLPFVETDPSATLQNEVWDWFIWRGLPHSMLVNRDGRRFTDEQASYSATYFNYFEYDIRKDTFRNMPATFIFDQNYIDRYSWPTEQAWALLDTQEKSEAPTQPSFIKGPYNTIEELAQDWNIDPEGLKDEIAKFDQYCQTGVDPEFGRGASKFDIHCTSYTGGPRTDLANPCLGPIGKAPFYALKMVPGACGTNGGPKINVDAQILGFDGQPIPGLYGSGNLVANVFGSGYPGSGGTEGPGCYYAFRAINHAYQMGIV